MKTITLDNCEYELTDERFEKLLASGAIVKPKDFDEHGEHYINCWHKFTYEDICMFIKGPG